jgi:hypothetical protein
MQFGAVAHEARVWVQTRGTRGGWVVTFGAARLCGVWV